MGLKILVAEDSPSIALLYKKSLEKRGHTVIITENGLKCLYQYSDDFKIRVDDKKKPFPVNAMIRQVEGVNARWIKKMVENTAKEPWDGEEGLSEVLQ